MRNRAKCKLCGDLIESLHQHDYVKCKCGEIFVDGGNEYWRCGATDFKNFLRVDDEGNEKEVKFIEHPEDKNPNQPDEIQERTPSMTRQQHIGLLKDMVDQMERLPEQVLLSPVSHYDHLSLLIWLVSFSRSLDAQQPDQPEQTPS